jgi:hypothetical protein
MYARGASITWNTFLGLLERSPSLPQLDLSSVPAIAQVLKLRMVGFP